MYQVKEGKSLFGVKGTVSGSDIATAYIAPTETKERGPATDPLLKVLS